MFFFSLREAVLGSLTWELQLRIGSALVASHVVAEARAIVARPPDATLSATAAVDRLDARREAILSLPPGALIDALAADDAALRALRAVAPPSASCGPETWKDLIRRLQRDVGAVDPGPVDRLIRALPAPAAQRAVRALLHGDPPAPALDRPSSLGPRDHHAIRWLHKRRDLLAFLRFADCVPCCFNSTSTMYRSTQAMVLSLWKDPLSFCFQILRRRGDGPAEPRGFVFGSFALAGGAPAVLLNGVYLKRQLEPIRFAALDAIERDLCRPLGIRHLAVATRYGGRGPLPPGYRPEPRRVHRLRALADPAGGGLVTRIYDDISSLTNVEMTTHSDVHWKDLDPT